MGLFRKILIFVMLTAGLVALGRLAGRFLPRPASPAASAGGPTAKGASPDTARDSTNALPPVEADTTGGRWHERLFDPLERANGLGPKSLKHKPGYYEIAFPKGKPIHEYALEIEKTCRARGITVLQGAELRPANRSVEYLLESNGQRIKLRAVLGASVMAGAARLAVVFLGLDSLTLSQAEALQTAAWDKTLVIDPYNPNPALRALRDGDARDELLAELPMEPAAYPYVDPGKHALFIHHTKEDVERILGEALDSLPKATGFASRYGDRAIENQPLLEKLFQFTARRKLAFLDFTGSQRSLARQTAAAQGARSRTLALFRDSVHAEEELARKAILAQKTGEAVLAMPFTETAFRSLRKSIEANLPRFNEIGLELVGLSDLAAPDTLASETPGKGDGRIPAAGTKPGAANPPRGAAAMHPPREAPAAKPGGGKSAPPPAPTHATHGTKKPVPPAAHEKPAAKPAAKPAVKSAAKPAAAKPLPHPKAKAGE
jgi:polysaccharide deacetylase 2 family uncharacterized protein YibQ